MLFVFGKRAKQLRLNKVSELIHKSDQCSPTAATVTVYMEEIIDLPPPSTTETGRESYTSQSVDPLPYEIVPNSQVILSRTAKSDNSSVYKLNGKTTQFRDINAFLNTKGIDLEHNRFLILQGEVELIAMMPPKAKNEGDNDGLLEYLEDIIGSHTFVPATQEAAEKIEALGVIRQERLNRVKAAQNETKSLEGAKKEAQQLLRKERAIRQEQSKLYQRERLIVQRKSASLATKKEELDTEIEQYREKTSGASGELEELMERHEEFRVEYNKANDELEKTQQEFSAFERRDIKLREAVKHTKQTIKEWEKKVVEHEKKQNTAQRKHDSAVERIPELEKQIEDLKASKLEEEAILEEIQEETRHATHKLRSELEAKTEALAPLMQDRTARQTALDTAQTELNLIQDATREAQKRLEDATQELANLEDNHEKKKEALREHQTTIDESKKQLDSLQTEDRNLADEEAQLSRKHKSQLVSFIISNLRLCYESSRFFVCLSTSRLGLKTRKLHCSRKEVQSHHRQSRLYSKRQDREDHLQRLGYLVVLGTWQPLTPSMMSQYQPLVDVWTTLLSKLRLVHKDALSFSGITTLAAPILSRWTK